MEEKRPHERDERKLHDEKEPELEDLGKNDPGLENTTDPQEKMEGPVSSFVQDVKDTAETIGGETSESGTDEPTEAPDDLSDREDHPQR